MRSLEYISDSILTDPYPVYREYRKLNRVIWSEEINMYCVFKFRHIKHILTSPQFSVEYPFRISRQVYGTTLLDLDGYDHKRQREQIAKIFQKTNINKLYEAIFQEETERLLDNIEGKGKINFVKDFCIMLPSMVIGKFLGIADNDIAWVVDKINYLTDHLDGSKGDFDLVTKSRRELYAFIRDKYQELKSRQQKQPFMSVFSDEVNLPVEELHSMFVLILAAGIETSVASLSNIMVCLMKHPDYLILFRKDPTILPNIINEAIRFEPPQHDTVRFATEDCEIDGVRIKKGRALKLMIASGNRDEEVYKDPELFNPYREEKLHLSFGNGPHACLGKAFAMKELELAYRSFLSRFPSVSLDEPMPFIEGATFRKAKYLSINLN